MIEKILSTKFARKAIETALITQENRPCAANVFRFLIESIDRLAKSCQLTEFTEHGIPHLYSLINRVETWTINNGDSLLTKLNHNEACLLFFAVLIHDIGMLSQREDDLPEEDKLKYARQFADLAGWIRRTHTLRITGTTRRLLIEGGFTDLIDTDFFKSACLIAQSHACWPDNAQFDKLFNKERNITQSKLLAAILAVVDLLDEDSSRCDSMTLFINKVGNLMNRAHWFRHMLTANYLQIKSGIVEVFFQEPENLKNKLEGTFIGLKNHLSQCMRYNTILSTIGAEILLNFKSEERRTCNSFPDNDDELAMLYIQPDIHILRTFFEEIIPPVNEDNQNITIHGIEIQRINREIFDIAVNSEFGRSDYEITYIASLLSGEDSRKSAMKILQKAAWHFHERGDISQNQRLASFVLEQTIKFNKQTIQQILLNDDLLWAAVFKIHWASSESDIRRVAELFDQSSMRGVISLEPLLKGIPFDWKIIALTCYLVLKSNSKNDFNLVFKSIDEIFSEQCQDCHRNLSSEETIAWYDLIEALWGLGYLNDNSIHFWQKFKYLQQMESNKNPILKELSWRMAVQSHCFNGLNRWQFIELNKERSEYSLSEETSRELIANAWISWFNRMEIDSIAIKAHQANPLGSEYYLAGLETCWMAMNFDFTLQNYEEFKRIRQKLNEARENEQSIILINKIRARLLADVPEPKEEDVVYMYHRGIVKLLPIDMFIGERIALRRWLILEWKNLIQTNIQRILNFIYPLSLEKEDISEPVIFCILEIGWVDLIENDKKRLKKVLEMNEKTLSVEQIHQFISQLILCPPKIGKINHPGLIMIEDSLSSDSIQILIDITMREYKFNSDILPKDYIVWSNVLPYIELTSKQWDDLDPLINTCLFKIHQIESKLKPILNAFFQLAPWIQVSKKIEQIVDWYNTGKANTDWSEEIKANIVIDVLNREDRSWEGSIPIKKLITILRTGSPLTEPTQDDLLMAEWLENPHAEHTGPQYEALAISMVESLEKIIKRAQSRQSPKFGFGGGFPSIIAKLPTVTEDLSIRTAENLKSLWSIPYPAINEIHDVCVLATYILRSSNSKGVQIIFNALFDGLKIKWNAFGIGDKEDGSIIIWDSVAKNLSLISDYMINNLFELILHRLNDLSLKVRWTPMSRQIF